jgi:hypothetical protein
MATPTTTTTAIATSRAARRRQQQRRPSSPAAVAAAAEQLKILYTYLRFVADMASPEVFATQVDQVQLTVYLDHVLEALREISCRPEWEETGCLPTEYDDEMADSLHCFCKHQAFLQLHMQRNVMSFLAELCAKVKPPRLHSAKFAQYVLRFVNNTNWSHECSQREDDSGSPQQLTSEQSYRIIEKSGLLLQVLRLVTIAQPDYQPHRVILDKLQNCPKLLKGFLGEPDSPGHQVLDDLLLGRNGYPTVVDEQIRQRLVAIGRVASLATKTLQPSGFDVRLCRNCGKDGFDLGLNVKLLVCSRCKATYYCTKECQVADWKKHRKTCGQGHKPSKTSEQTLFSYVIKFYYEILKALSAVMQERSVPKSQLLIDLDFRARIDHADDSSSPALRGEIKAAVIKDYLRGRDQPSWFGNCDEASQSNILANVRDQSQRELHSHLLVLSRHAAGGAGIFRLHALCPSTQKSLFADELVTAFGERDWATMEQYLDDSMIRSLRHKITNDEMGLGGGQSGDLVGNGMLDLYRRIAAFQASPQWDEFQREMRFG